MTTLARGTWTVDPKTGALILLPPVDKTFTPLPVPPPEPKLYTGVYL